VSIAGDRGRSARARGAPDGIGDADVARILIADDDEAIRWLVRRAIESSGDRLKVVAEAVDGTEAVRAWRESQPDLIVLDHDMPGLTGTEVAGIILGERPEQAIVIFSGFATSPDVAAVVDLGVRAVVDKSRLTELPSLIRHTLSPTISIAGREDRAV
jgi:DNA-binding NarL/FixJ family response regulator